MNRERFWEIVERSKARTMERQEKKLRKALKKLSDTELAEYLRIESQLLQEIYSSDLWDIACLYWGGGCGDDGFMDWRNSMIYMGKKTFEVARDNPEKLLPYIEAFADVGDEGIGYVAEGVFEDRDPDWEANYPDIYPDSSPPLVRSRPEIEFPGHDAPEKELEAYHVRRNMDWKAHYPEIYARFSE